MFRPYARHVALLIVLIAATSALDLLPALVLKEIVENCKRRRDNVPPRWIER